MMAPLPEAAATCVDVFSTSVLQLLNVQRADRNVAVQLRRAGPNLYFPISRRNFLGPFQLSRRGPISLCLWRGPFSVHYQQAPSSVVFVFGSLFSFNHLSPNMVTCTMYSGRVASHTNLPDGIQIR